MKILEGKTVNRRWIEYGEAVHDVWDDMSPKEEIF
jgi:hypothetical protein